MKINYTICSALLLVLIVFCDTFSMNKNNNKEQQTIDYYDRDGKAWSQKYGPGTKQSFWVNELKEFNTLLRNGTLLEIGVGGGREADELIKMGYQYTGIDSAASLIQIAQQRFPNAQFFTQNVTELHLPHNSFDGFWCSATLIHVSKEHINQALHNIYQVLKPGAIGFITLAAGTGEHQDEATGRWFFLYTEDEFAELLKKNGFLIIKRNVRHRETEQHWLQTWLTFFVQKK